MKIYSQNVHLFLKRWEVELKKILQDELHLEVRRSRFKYQNYLYPIDLVMIESETTLGFFDPHTYQIALNQKLMFGIKDHIIRDILRHELAHFLCYLEFGGDTSAHGDYFKTICTRYQWNEAAKASLNLDLKDDSLEGDLKAQKMKIKFQALLKLSESDNIHEAEIATLRANELLIRYNLDKVQDHDEAIYAKVLLTSKRKSAKLICIYDIIRSFMVRPIFIYGKSLVRLEVCGRRENIELAEYVANFLENELENLWKKSGLKGTREKNSFFRGIASGYSSKHQEMGTHLKESDQRSLMVIEKTLDLNMQQMYSRLSYSSSQSKTDAKAFGAGQKVGKSLSINPAIKNKTKSKLLSWRNL